VITIQYDFTTGVRAWHIRHDSFTITPWRVVYLYVFMISTIPPDAPVLTITDDRQLAYTDTTTVVAHQIRTRVVLRTGVIAGWIAGT
jgi:hypothetical protein